MIVRSTVRRRVAAAITAAAAISALGGLATAGPASAAPACSDVEFIFARGSGELPGLGIMGGPTFNALKNNLRGQKVTSYAVNYSADWSQTNAHRGGDDLVNRITKRSQECAEMKFVIGGYSQGGTVVHLAAGSVQARVVGGGASKVLTSAQADKVVAAVTFGPAPMMMGGKLSQNKYFAKKSKEFCAMGDPVCGGGVNVMAHVTYSMNGNTNSAAKFAADQVKASTGAPAQG